jgi:hypothetical protein
METLLFASVALTSLAFAFACYVLVRTSLYRSGSKARESSGADFTANRYVPMAELLSENEFSFLAGQPGISPKMLSRFRKERRRVFRGYLRELACDFYQLHAEARALALHAPAEHASLPARIMTLHLQFWWQMYKVEAGLAYGTFGIGTIDVSTLVKTLDGLQLQVNRAPAAA